MKIQLLDDRLLVRIEPPGMTPGGIALPDTKRTRSRVGKVLSVGDGKLLDNGTRVPFRVKAGDRVLFIKFDGPGTDAEFEDRDVKVIREIDVIGVLLE